MGVLRGGVGVMAGPMGVLRGGVGVVAGPVGVLLEVKRSLS